MRTCCVLLLAALTAGCDGLIIISPTQPAQSSALPIPIPQPAQPQFYEIIGAGQRFDGRLTSNGEGKFFLFVAPADGILFVRVSWNMASGRLELWSGSRGFAGDGLIVARIAVVAGQRCFFSVNDGAPWDYGGLNLAFALNVEFE